VAGEDAGTDECGGDGGGGEDGSEAAALPGVRGVHEGRLLHRTRGMRGRSRQYLTFEISTPARNFERDRRREESGRQWLSLK
jgi:hypothetical protein